MGGRVPTGQDQRFPALHEKKGMVRSDPTVVDHASHPPEDGGAPPPYGCCELAVTSGTI